MRPTPMAGLGIIPKAAAKKIWDKGKGCDLRYRAHRRDRARRVKHDVIAFLTHLAEIVGARGALRAPGP